MKWEMNSKPACASLHKFHLVDVSENISIEPWFAAGPVWEDNIEVSNETFYGNKVQSISTIHILYQIK